jgi:hypothetical protein
VTQPFQARCGLRKGWVTEYRANFMWPLVNSAGHPLTRCGVFEGLNLIVRREDTPGELKKSKGASLFPTRCGGRKGGAIHDASPRCLFMCSRVTQPFQTRCRHKKDWVALLWPVVTRLAHYQKWDSSLGFPGEGPTWGSKSSFRIVTANITAWGSGVWGQIYHGWGYW